MLNADFAYMRRFVLDPWKVKARVLLRFRYLFYISIIFSIFTFILMDRINPRVISITPPDKASGVYDGSPIAVSFSSAMAAKTINNATFTLRDNEGALVSAKVSYDAEMQIAELVPTFPLQAGATYELSIGPDPRRRPRSILGLALSESMASRFTTASIPQQLEGADAPILIATGKSNPFGAYYAEILKAEGLNLYGVVDSDALTPERLVSTKIVILTTAQIPDAIADRLTRWVRAGGNLIAIKPEGEWLQFFGLAKADPPVWNAYLLPDASNPASHGIVQDTIQIHGAASRFILQDATAVAQLFETATKPLPNPAVTLRAVGDGHVAAFAYDLASSVVWTRQGNPDWIDQERDGHPPRRANDLFYPDYLNMAKVGIPQADEQQRLLANLIMVMSEGRPLPRFWYLPDGRRAAILMAGDDHATRRGTADTFNRLLAESPAGCRFEFWECARATSYLTIKTSITPKEIEQYISAGFEVGVHVDDGCQNRGNKQTSLEYSNQITNVGAYKFGIMSQETHRLHCIAWNGWADTAKIERTHGIRLSLDYYYWPGSWIEGRQGFMTGSGFPMRFADLDGTPLEIYQATTHLVNQNGVNQLGGVSFMLDRALGPEQFFGVFGTHYDYSDTYFNTLLSAAKARSVAMISAAQMLHWLEFRDNTRFEHITWNHDTVSFHVGAGSKGELLTAMLPIRWPPRQLSAIRCEGRYIQYEVQTIKGLDYAFFPVKTGNCFAIYGTNSPSSLP